MDTIDILNNEFLTQDFAEEQPYVELLDKYKDIPVTMSRWRTLSPY